jgi:hypothetical protein
MACSLRPSASEDSMNTPPVRFFIFGAGNRPKLIYRRGELVDWLTGEVRCHFDVDREVIDAPSYCVEILEKNGNRVMIQEDADGIRLQRNGVNSRLVKDQSVQLPSFEGHRHQSLLRVLHHEILVNILDGKPLPNFLVYAKPWHRDAAMMAMVLEKTGNTVLIKDWVLGLDSVFDRNNAGHEEADNIGQVLYLVSLFSDARHPRAVEALSRVAQFAKGSSIEGMTDFAPRPVYQTKWLKFGLARLGLADPYVVPDVDDAYEALSWWGTDNTVRNGSVRRFSHDMKYPYLTWAEAHLLGDEPPLDLAGPSSPLTWETEASQADYNGMAIIDPAFVTRKQCMPHTWHAAEMFLYLYEKE